MCQLASFKHNPGTLEIRVADLCSHGDTETLLGIRPDSEQPDQWRDGHYLPDGTIECRTVEGDSHASAQCEKHLRKRFPTYRQFLRWACKQPAVKVRNAELIAMKLSKDGKTLYARDTGIVDVSKNVALQTLDARGTGIVDVSKNVALQTLYASGTGIVDVSKNVALQTLDARDTGIVDVSKNVALQTLYARGTGIVDVSKKVMVYR